MNEATIVRKIITHLTNYFGAKATVLKHNDRMTAGIPDITVTHGGITWWLEVKLFRSMEPTRSELKKAFDALQLARMRSLDQNGRAYYLVAFHRDGERDTRLNLMCVNSVVRCLEESAPMTVQKVLTFKFSGTIAATMEHLVGVIRAAS